MYPKVGEWLIVERVARILKLTLNRPDRRNALNCKLCRDLADTMEAAAADPTVGAIALFGAGPAFCAGMDLKEILEGDSTAQSRIHERLFTMGLRINKPIVAGVHGAALAGGTGVVANAHIVVAGEDAQFGLTEVRIGLWPFVVLRSVEAAIGKRRATEWSLTARIIGPAEAASAGLVHHIVPVNSVIDRTMEIAQGLSESSAVAIEAGLRFSAATRRMKFDEVGALALQMREEVFRSEDFAEGVAAFREKRKPRWPSIAE